MRIVAFHMKPPAQPVLCEDLHGFPCGACWVILMLVGGCVSRETRIGVLGLSTRWLLLGRVWWGYAFRYGRCVTSGVRGLGFRGDNSFA